MLLSYEEGEFLRQKAPALIQQVIPSDALWTSLIKYKVISEVVKKDITVSVSQRFLQIEREHIGETVKSIDCRVKSRYFA